MRSDRSRRSGLTLVELMIVISVIMVLIALLLPAIQSARETARMTQCRNNLMQLGVALHMYSDSHSVLPPGCISVADEVRRSFRGPKPGWITHILPQLGLKAHALRVNADEPWRSFLGPEAQRALDLWPEARQLAELQMNAGPVAAEVLSGSDSDESEPLIDDVVIRDIRALTDMYLGLLIEEEELRVLRAAAEDSEEDTDGDEFYYGGYAGYGGGMGASNGPPLFPEFPPVSGLQCPSNPVPAEDGFSCYAGVHHHQAAFVRADNTGLLYLNSSESLFEIPDGASATLLLCENSWFEPRDSWFYGDHSTLCNIAPLDTNSGLTRGMFGAGTRGENSARLSAADQLHFLAGDPDVQPEPGMSDGAAYPNDPAGGDEEAEAEQPGNHPSSAHFGGSHFLLADGSVRFLSESVAVEILRRMADRGDGTLVSADSF